MDCANIRMIQGRGCSSFTLEPLKRLRIVCQFFREKLQCDVAAELQVFRLIHHTHTATAEFLEDAVMRDGLADHDTRAADSCAAAGRPSAGPSAADRTLDTR